MSIKAAIVGCGNIAGRYAEDIATYDELTLVGVTDIDTARAEAFAAEHQTTAHPTLDALLKDDKIELVINLTTHHVHKQITQQCLEADKHVYSEKPLATTYADAKSLVDLAEQKNLRLGSSPFTLMGEAQQTAWKVIREGKLGEVRVAYAEVNWGRIESWHPAPGPFYEVGALFDVGVYPLTILTAMFGPAKRVLAYGKVLYPDRTTREGNPFSIQTPDFIVSVLELASGMVVRLTTNFYVGHHNRQTGIEFHGDEASVYLSSWQNFNAEVQFSAFGEQYETVPYLREPYEGTTWGRGVWEMASAMLADRPHRFTGRQAAHITEILEAAARSVNEECPVELQSTFTPPEPMDWARA